MPWLQMPPNHPSLEGAVEVGHEVVTSWGE